MLEQRKCIAFSRQFLPSLAEALEVLPIAPASASSASALALPQGDPFDRIIVATALHHGLTLVTKDAAITQSGLVPVLW